MSLSLPVSKTVDELREMKPIHLGIYFRKHFRYFPDAPPDAKYAIQFGNKAIFSKQEDGLLIKFFEACGK